MKSIAPTLGLTIRLYGVLVASTFVTATIASTGYCQERGLSTSSGVLTLQPMPVGFYGQLMKGYLPREKNTTGVRIFELQVTGPFDHDKIDYTVRTVARNIELNNETLNDQRAVVTNVDSMHHTVIGCLNVKTKQVDWLAMTRRTPTSSWWMTRGDRTPRVSEAWVAHRVRIDVQSNAGLVLAGADDDNGRICIGYDWYYDSGDWDSPSMSRTSR